MYLLFKLVQEFPAIKNMTDEQLGKTIRHLVCADTKPKDISPVDMLQVIRMLVQRGDEAPLYMSQTTLAEQLGVSVETIQTSQKRLRKHGWLVIRKGGSKGRTNLYSVDLDALPVAGLKRTVITAEALALAQKYAETVIAQGGWKTKKPRTRPRKKPLKIKQARIQMWAFVLTTLVKRSKTGNNWDGLAAILGFAFGHPKFRNLALSGPGKLKPLRVWGDLVASYTKWAQSQQPPTANPAA